MASLTYKSPRGMPATVILATFTNYFVTKPISASLSLPCAGTGTLAFVPSLGSSTAVAAKVSVTFVGQP